VGVGVGSAVHRHIIVSSLRFTSVNLLTFGFVIV